MQTMSQHDRYQTTIDVGIRIAEEKAELLKKQMAAEKVHYAVYAENMNQFITYGIMISVMQVAKNLLESDTQQVIFHFDSDGQTHLESVSEDAKGLLSVFNASYEVIEQKLKPIKNLDASSEYYRIISAHLSTALLIDLIISGLVCVVCTILCCTAIMSPAICGIVVGTTLGSTLLIMVAKLSSEMVRKHYCEQSKTLNNAFLEETTIIQADPKHQNLVARLVPLLETPSMKQMPLFNNSSEKRLPTANLMALGFFPAHYPFNELTEHNTIDLIKFKSRLISDQDNVMIGPRLSN